jgi:hypothetical protein
MTSAKQNKNNPILDSEEGEKDKEYSRGIIIDTSFDS